MPDRDWWAALWPDPAGMVRALGVRPGMSVLDLCCGDGYFTIPLAKIVGGRVYGLDLEPDLIAQARDAADRQGASTIEWIAADAHRIAAVIDHPLDFVLIANTFHGVPDKTDLARIVADALAPQGLFAIVNWHPLPREHTTVLDQPRGPPTEMRMSPEVVRTIVEPAGFAQSQLVDLPPYHYGAVFAKRS
jgi:SAM-dependent methyltransferase